MNIIAYIFSWKGQYNNTIELEHQLSKHLPVVVINSDENNTKDHWITLNDSCYFSDQFKRAILEFDNKYDALWHIQSDVSFSNWELILSSAIELYNKYNWGIYAPNVIDSFYIPSRTDVFELEKNISVVGTPDCSSWIIHKDFIEEMKKYLYLMDNNHYGWGWDLLLSAFSHLKARPVIRDYNYTVNHPASTGYKKNEAEEEMINMILSCPNDIKQVIIDIKQNHKNIINCYGLEQQKQENILIYRTC